MKKIFLDSNIILKYPEILSYKRKDAELIIPDLLYWEIRDLGLSSAFDIFNIIQKSEEKGNVSIAKIPQLPTAKEGVRHQNYVDNSIIQYINRLNEMSDDEIIFVTADEKYANEAKRRKIKVWNISNLLEFYKTPGSTKDQAIRQEAVQVENKIRWGILSNLLLAILFLTAFVLMARYYGDIVDQLKNATMIIILIVFGFLLFEVREKRRQLYGFVEIGFGILTIVIVFYPNLILNNWDILLKIAAGLYIVVRGLDNLYKGSEKTKLGPLLKRLFRLNG